MKELKELVSDADVQDAFKGTNFGSEKPRNIIFDTLLKRATGYHAGHTAEAIAIELKLISPKAKKLTRKGGTYLYSAVQLKLKPAKTRGAKQKLIPCPHQNAVTWVCQYGIVKPKGKCLQHSFVSRPIQFGKPMKSSIQCLILNSKGA